MLKRTNRISNNDRIVGHASRMVPVHTPTAPSPAASCGIQTAKQGMEDGGLGGTAGLLKPG